MNQNEISRLRAQLAVVSSLLDEAEERLRDGLAPDAKASSATEPAVAAASGTAPGEAPPAVPVGLPIPTPQPRRAPGAVSPLGPGWSETAGERLREVLRGPRGLAVIGGTILILGLAFLYVFASQQGILGPKGRTITGALISFALIGAAIAIQHRYKQLVGAVAAMGAGLAGLYLALVAATRIYDLIPTWQGLALAGVVAAYAIAMARSWDSEWLALFGIVGALGAPVFLDAGITPGTILFVAVLAAAAAWLWVERGWTLLAGAAGALAGCYALALVVSAGTLDRAGTGWGWNEFWQSVAGAALFWAVLTAASLARQRIAPDQVRTVRLVVGGAGLAVAAAEVMFHVGDAGVPLLVIAGVYALLGAGVHAGTGDRGLTLVFALISLSAVLLASIELLDGASRVAALAAEGMILAVAASRLRSRGLQGAAVAYLGLSAVFTIVEAAPLEGLVSFPPERLSNAAGTAMDPGATAGAIAATVLVALGLLALAFGARVMDTTGELRGEANALGLAAAVAVLYAVATAIVDGALLVSYSQDTFLAAHAALSIVWGVAALAILVVGLRRRSALIRNAGLALLGVTLAKLVLYDLSQLAPFGRAVAFVVVGVIFVAGSVAYQRMAAADDDVVDP